MTEPFDAVLAEMRSCCEWPRMGYTDYETLKQWAERLAAAHAAEKSTWFLRAREEAERCGQAEARADRAMGCCGNCAQPASG